MPVFRSSGAEQAQRPQLSKQTFGNGLWLEPNTRITFYLNSRMTDLGFAIAQPPADGISALRFADHSNSLLAASWDGVRTGVQVFY